LVYCVEAIDHEGLRTDAIRLPDEAELKTMRRKDLLGDVVTVVADAEVTYESTPGAPDKVRSMSLMAVPYYAWANRGDGYMDVWLARTASATTPLPALTAGAEAKVSTSDKRPDAQLAALTDRRVGANSKDRTTPRFTSIEKTTGHQWIQYEWDKSRTLSKTAVYWAIDAPAPVYWRERTRGSLLQVPKSWRLLYKSGDSWLPIETSDSYGLNLDRNNELRFTPVMTTAVRLEIEISDAPCAIQEWMVD